MAFATWSDARLLQATREGAAEAFGVLFDRHAEVVLVYLQRRAPSAEDAADLVSETFAAALVAAHGGRASGVIDAAPWLIGIAKHKLVDAYRRGEVRMRAMHQLGLERPADASFPGGGSAELGAELPAGVVGAINSLAPVERRTVLERVLHETDYAEMAARDGLPDAIVRKRFSRAMGRVRGLLGAQS